jgi:hypothetical protein
MRGLILGAATAMPFLAGCSAPADGPAADLARHGRYVGVGIYPAGQMWSQVVVANAPKDAAASRSSDDEQVIVVVDSATGELRQCGNLSGYCVGMNPWRGKLAPSQIAPVPLTRHADHLTQKVTAAAEQDEAAPESR